MNWLYHFNYNWKNLLMWFHKKHLGKFFIQTNINVLEKKHFVEKLLPFERWQKLFWRFLYQNPFYMFIKMLNEIKEKNFPKIYQNITLKKYIFLLKVTPCSVVSPYSPKQNNIYIS